MLDMYLENAFLKSIREISLSQSHSSHQLSCPYYLSITTILKSTNNTCWQGCEVKGNLLPCCGNMYMCICVYTTSAGSSVQFSSVAQSYPTLCDPMNHSMPGLSVHHQLPEFTQTHVHRVSEAIQPSHPLSSSSPPAPSASQHQSLFQ